MNKFIIGDLVKSKSSGKVGIIKEIDPKLVNYCYVLFRNKTYVTHRHNLEPLEKL